MKKILITGANSYIGTSVEKWLLKEKGKYKIDTLSVRGSSWKEKDFSGFDVIFHVAAVVHKKEKPEMKEQYFQINRELPIEIAKKAKAEGVKQLIFMSTMAVYGEEGKLSEEVVITKDTKPNPKTFYGISKLEAEYELNKLVDNDFKIVVIRPPMVYGPNCPGNYGRLEKLVMKTPIFPVVENKRSIIHIDKLCQYIKSYIDSEAAGLFLPQDDEYMNISTLVRKLAEKRGKKIILSKFMGKLIKLIGNRVDVINKVFGNLVYEK